MKNPSSPIIDMYPTDFSLDMNGKKYEWMGVVLLPFLDEPRLHLALKDVYSNLNEDEIQRNKIGENFLMISRKNPIYAQVRDLYEKDLTEATISDKPERYWSIFITCYVMIKLILRNCHIMIRLILRNCYVIIRFILRNC